MLSLETGYIRYAILTHIVICTLSLFFTGVNFVFLLSYITFMGVCPIARAVFEKLKLHPAIAFVINQIWFTLSIIVTIIFGSAYFGYSLDNATSVIIIIAITIPSFFFYNLGMVNIRRKIRLFAERRRGPSNV